MANSQGLKKSPTKGEPVPGDKCPLIPLRLERTSNFFHVYLFILREGGQGERENPKQAPCCQRKARRRVGAHEPWDYDLSRDRESEAQLTGPPQELQSVIPCGQDLKKARGAVRSVCCISVPRRFSRSAEIGKGLQRFAESQWQNYFSFQMGVPQTWLRSVTHSTSPS